MTTLEKTLAALIAQQGMDAVLLALSRVCAFQAEKPSAEPVWNRDSHRFASMCQER